MQTMNYKEAARYLKITEGTLRNWVSKGRLKPHKVGKHVLFFKEELETWITNPTPAEPTEKPQSKPEAHNPTQATAEKTAPPTEWAPQFKMGFEVQPCENVR
jgi:excisionase family DNA binding protein